MNSDSYIHVALLGPVSAGKTTLLNALLVARYGDMAMKRTTMTEAIYYESSDEKLTAAADIHAKNTEVNKLLYEKAKSSSLTAADLVPIEHFVPPVHELLVGKLNAGVRLAIHDLPGLNDAQTKTMYHDYVAANFHKYNIAILVLDVHSGMNTSDEKDILTLIARQMRNNKMSYGIETALIVVINKCDDMEVKDHNSGETAPTDPEYMNMVKQVRVTVESVIKNYDPLSPICVRFACLSAEDSYIYRMYSRNPDCVVDQKHRNKFGINAFGKHTWAKMSESKKAAAFRLKVREKNADAIELAGFRHLDWKLANLLTPEMQYRFLIAPLKVRMTGIVFTGDLVNVVLDERVKADVIKFKQIKAELRDVAAKFGKSDGEQFFAMSFDTYLTKYERARKSFMEPMNVQRAHLIDFQILRTMHSIMSIVRVDMSTWLITPRASKLSVIAANANSFIINTIVNVGANSVSEIHSLIGRIIFPQHSADPSLLGMLTFTNDDDDSKYIFDWQNMTNVEIISLEVCSMLWMFGLIPWKAKVELINDLLTSASIEMRVILILRNLRLYLKTHLLIDPRWEALEVYSHYYVNSEFMTGGLGFGSANIAIIKKYLRMSPASARTTTQEPVSHRADYDDIAYAVQYCLAELSKLYPKHVVDLDAFYGAPRNGPDLDEFYEREI